MKVSGTVAAAFAAGLFAAGSDAIHLRKRETPSVVSMPIQRRAVANPIQRDALRRRATKTVSETLGNFEQGSLYFANVTLGTPPQSFRFHLDTGSSDLWTNAANSQYCLSGGDTRIGGISCSVSGTYDANSSSTYSYVDSEFQISYADGSGAAGDYVKDTLSIGGIQVTALQFGVGYQSSSAEGVMGIGYPSLEVQSENNGEQAYANIPQAMVQQSFINSAAYSLWLDDLDSSTGSILFGGVDTDKYQGSLQTVPIVKETIGGVSEFLEMVIALSGVSLLQNGQNTSITTTAFPVLLDSGSTLSYLPVDVAEPIYSALGVTWNNREQGAFCPCSLANSSATIDFEFSGQVISVGMEEMVIPGGLDTTDEACTFGIFETQASTGGGSSFTLGDTFIRSAYLVYDLANNQISLAQTNFEATSSNVMEITTGANSVPDASGVANVVSVSATGTATPVNGGGAATTGGASTSGATSSSAGSTGSSSSSIAFAPTLVATLGTWAGVAGAAVLYAL